MEELRGIIKVFLKKALSQYVLQEQMFTSATGVKSEPLIISSNTIASTNFEEFPCRSFYRNYCKIYGFGSRSGVRYVLSPSILRVLDSVHPDLGCSGEALSVFHDLSVEIIEKLLLASARAATASPPTTYKKYQVRVDF